MTEKRFDHPNDNVKDMKGYNGVSANEPVDVLAEDLYSRLGARFPVKWEPWATAEPVIDTADLPGNVSEADVEAALVNMKSEGLL